MGKAMATSSNHHRPIKNVKSNPNPMVFRLRNHRQKNAKSIRPTFKTTNHRRIHPLIVLRILMIHHLIKKIKLKNKNQHNQKKKKKKKNPQHKKKKKKKKKK